jgi:hypothetical protein
MMYSNIGKFEARKLIADFDALLIQLYGLNMTDAKITRQDAVAAINTAGSTRSAVETLGAARGLLEQKAA